MMYKRHHKTIAFFIMHLPRFYFLRAIVLFCITRYTSSRGLRMKTNSNHILWYFTYECMNKNIVFSENDFYNFAKACNLEVDVYFAKKNFFYNNLPKSTPHSKKTFVATKSLLGPCYVHSTDLNPKQVKYNISNIIKDLQLSRQDLTPKDKLQKIFDYIKLAG